MDCLNIIPGFERQIEGCRGKSNLNNDYEATLKVNIYIAAVLKVFCDCFINCLSVPGLLACISYLTLRKGLPPLNPILVYY